MSSLRCSLKERLKPRATYSEFSTRGEQGEKEEFAEFGQRYEGGRRDEFKDGASGRTSFGPPPSENTPGEEMRAGNEM